MKKILILISIASLFISSCSSNDSSNNNTDSTIKINGVSFVPGLNNDILNYVITSFNAGEANSRVFGFQNNTDVLLELESLQIDVIYPLTQENINGTYILNDFNSANGYFQGTYSKGLSIYSFTSGSVAISDLGNSKYKVEFLNTVLTNTSNDTDTITITGYYKGTFAVD